MNRKGGGWVRYGFVAPTLIFLIAFNVFPLFYNVILSFTNTELVGESSKWVELQNYDRVFTNARFASALRRTAWFVFCTVSIELVIGFSAALALHGIQRGRATLVTLLLIPMMLSPAVMGLFWNLILNGNYGILNQVLEGAGISQPQWLTDRDWKFFAVALVDIWMWTPFLMLISLAGLNSIPKSIYEAAEIDRATTWTVFRRITLPLVAPYLGLAVLFRVTDALKQFDIVMATQGPNDTSTQTLSTLLYQLTFREGKLGQSSAYACVILVVVIAVATVFTRYLDSLERRNA